MFARSAAPRPAEPPPAPADQPLVGVSVVASEVPELAWAVGRRFAVPASVGQALAPHLASDGELSIPVREKLADLRCAVDLRLHAAFTPRPPRFARLPFSAHRLPVWIRTFGASWLARRGRKRLERSGAFPRWPIDLSADFLSDLMGRVPSHRATGGPTPVLLTHDLDTGAGVASCLRDFLPVEEERGARSLNFVVGNEWPLDHAALHELRRRGHCLGIHGYDHSYRTSWLDPPVRRRRLEEMRPLMERYQIRGYRSPTLLRTRGLIEDLASSYDFDSSIPTAGGLIPVPDNGCTTARPFDLLGLREIPISMPMDAALTFHGHSPGEMFDIWRECADHIAASGGVVVLLTHCEERFSGNPVMLDLYRRLLDWMAASGRFVWTSAAELVPPPAVSRWSVSPSTAKLPTTRAGFPITSENAGTVSLTTAPAPTMDPRPMVTPERTMAPTPMWHSRSITTGRRISGTSVRRTPAR